MALGTTVDDLLNRVRRDAVLGLHGPVYSLASNFTVGDGAIVLNEDPMHMGPGSIVALEAQLFYVTAVDSGSKTLSVIEGYLGSTPANVATPNIVEVDPRFPKAALIDYACQEINSWSGELWRTTAIDLDGNVRNRSYDLTGVTGGVLFLLDVRRMPEGVPVDDFFRLSWIGDSWPHMAGRLVRNMDTGEFASGFSLQLTQAPRVNATLRVVLAQPFVLDPFELTTDLVDDVGLEASWLDILEFGVRWRALSALTTGRVDWRTAGMAREAEEVTPLDMVRVTGMARDMRQLRLAQEGLALRGRYPFREN
jgi:hypothetical protein